MMYLYHFQFPVNKVKAALDSLDKSPAIGTIMLFSSSNRRPSIFPPLHFLLEHFVGNVPYSLATDPEVREGAHLVGGFQIPRDNM
jgi:hypothetical protein